MFDRVLVDGILVDPSNYAVSYGSTIVSFKPSFIESLKPGTHTVSFVYKNEGEAQSTFKIAQPSEPEVKDKVVAEKTVNKAVSHKPQHASYEVAPKTGDNPWLFTATASLLASAAFGFTIKRRAKHARR